MKSKSRTDRTLAAVSDKWHNVWRSRKFAMVPAAKQSEFLSFIAPAGLWRLSIVSARAPSSSCTWCSRQWCGGRVDATVSLCRRVWAPSWNCKLIALARCHPWSCEWQATADWFYQDAICWLWCMRWIFKKMERHSPFSAGDVLASPTKYWLL